MPPAYLKGPPAAAANRINWWCDGKEPFESAVIAHEVAARRNEMVREAYRCSACGVWHIGRPVRDPTPNKVFAQVIRREGAANGG